LDKLFQLCPSLREAAANIADVGGVKKIVGISGASCRRGNFVDRRIFMVGTVAGVGALATNGCGGGGNDGGGDASAPGLAPTAAPTASSEAPKNSRALAALLRGDGRYRTDQALLFLAPPTGVVKSTQGAFWETPARAGIASPKAGFGYGLVGPGYKFVDVFSGWAWVHPGGDWVDTAGQSQGTQPHWSVNANAVSGATAAFTYTLDVTAGVKAALDGKRWNAYVVRGTAGARAFTSAEHATPPQIAVKYADGSSSVLHCTLAAALEPSTAYAQGGATEVSVVSGRNAVIEFERPAKAVLSATLTLPVTQHWSGSGVISGYLADPPLNTQPLIGGLSTAYPLDVGIKAHPDVIFAHGYADSSSFNDWFGPTSINVFDAKQWSPNVFDPKAVKNPNLLPNVHQGKWLKNRGTTTLVNSSYAKEGFRPLAPGLGALRVNIPGSGAADGASVGYSGGFGCDLAMYLPDALCGTLDEIYIRYYLMLGAHDPEYLAKMKMFRSQDGTTAQYAQHIGKFGIGASHWTQYGGNDNIGGGNVGWTNRNAWMEYSADVGGGQTAPGVHSWDMIGYNGLMGSIGGLGAALFPGYWYCLECRLKLNTVDLSATPFTADPSKNLDDAEIDVWLDGRKVLEMRKFSYRKLPLDYGGPASYNYTTRMGKTPLARGLLVPIRNLGVTAITLNDYNGGVLPAGSDRVKFYAGLVVSQKPIGPMQGI
jgi:hypothetical protein